MPAETVVWLEGRAGRRLPMRQEAGDLAKAELEKYRTARALGERQGGAEAPEAVGSDVGPGQTRKLVGGPPTCPGSDRLGTEKGLREPTPGRDPWETGPLRPIGVRPASLSHGIWCQEKGAGDSETGQERGRGLEGGLCVPEATQLFGRTKAASSGSVPVTPPPRCGAPWLRASAASAAPPPGAPAPAPWPPAGPPRPECQ